MKHRKKVVKLGRMSSHRDAMLANMASSVIVHKRIHTTLPKAKAVVSTIDKLITWGKENSLHSRRLAFKELQDRTLVRKLFTEVAPSLADRKGGYTRIMRAGVRAGDGAPMAILELVNYESAAPVVEDKKEKKEKKEKTKAKKEAK